MFSTPSPNSNLSPNHSNSNPPPPEFALGDNGTPTEEDINVDIINVVNLSSVLNASDSVTMLNNT